MRRPSLFSLSAGTLLLSLCVQCGCSDSSPTASPAGAPSTTAAGDEHTEHVHPTEGPHHGDLVELGDEEYHAEIVHGAGSEVTIYMLDSHAEVAVPIDATEVLINVTHDGQAEQFRLPAAPEATDPAGKSSRFSLADEELVNDLDSHGTVARLAVSIEGKSYAGKIEHQHEAEGHAHDHQAGK